MYFTSCIKILAYWYHNQINTKYSCILWNHSYSWGGQCSWFVKILLVHGDIILWVMQNNLLLCGDENLWARVTHEIHIHWSPMNNNDSTICYMYICRKFIFLFYILTIYWYGVYMLSREPLISWVWINGEPMSNYHLTFWKSFCMLEIN